LQTRPPSGVKGRPKRQRKKYNQLFLLDIITIKNIKIVTIFFIFFAFPLCREATHYFLSVLAFFQRAKKHCFVLILLNFVLVLSDVEVTRQS
jgi:hypothetical protein